MRVNSRGVRGQSQPLLKLLLIVGAQLLQDFCNDLAFNNALTFLPMLCIVWLYGYKDLSNCWLYCIIIRPKHHISIFGKMGKVATKPHVLFDIVPRAALAKFFRNHPWTEIIEWIRLRM